MSSTPNGRAPLDAVVAEITNSPGRASREHTLRFGRAQLEAILGDLAAEGISTPPAVTRAMQLDSECAQAFVSPTPVTAWLDGQDFDTLTGEQIVEQVTRHAWRVQVGDRRGQYATEIAAWLTQRMVDALADDLPRIVDELRPAWDVTAADVAAAARAGLTGVTTAEEAIERGDEAVAAWRTVGPAVATLDRMAKLLDRLLFLCGHYVDPQVTTQRGRQHWLDASAAGPVALAAPSARTAIDPRTVKTGRDRSAIAAEIGQEITQRGEQEREAAEQTRRAYLEAERRRQLEPAAASNATPDATDDEPDTFPVVGRPVTHA